MRYIEDGVLIYHADGVQECQARVGTFESAASKTSACYFIHTMNVNLWSGLLSNKNSSRG